MLAALVSVSVPVPAMASAFAPVPAAYGPLKSVFPAPKIDSVEAAVFTTPPPAISNRAPPERLLRTARLAARATAAVAFPKVMFLVPLRTAGSPPSVTGLETLRLAIEDPRVSSPPLNAKVLVPAPNAEALSAIKVPWPRVNAPVNVFAAPMEVNEAVGAIEMLTAVVLALALTSAPFHTVDP